MLGEIERAVPTQLLGDDPKLTAYVIYDRDESPGVKFADAELMGLPLRLTVSSRNRKEGAVELQRRAGGEAEHVPRDAVVTRASELYAAELAALEGEPAG